MIGNAVPPAFSKIIAETVSELFNGNVNAEISTGIFKQQEEYIS